MNPKFVKLILKAKKGDFKQIELFRMLSFAITKPRTLDDLKTLVKVANKIIKLLEEDKKPSPKKD